MIVALCIAVVLLAPLAWLSAKAMENTRECWRLESELKRKQRAAEYKRRQEFLRTGR